MSDAPDIVIIGSGIGGSTMAAGLAASGARIVILERGERLPRRSENRDPRAIFQLGFFRPRETWYDGAGLGFNPGNYYNVGGNSKFYGAVLGRFRAEDFSELVHFEGISPAWPFTYADLEPWYCEAETLYRVRGDARQDPTEPFHSRPYGYPPVPDEPAVRSVRDRLAQSGIHPYALPLGIDIDEWLIHGGTPWDAHPDAFTGKMDAETAALAAALAHPNVRLETSAHVHCLLASPRTGLVEGVEYEQKGEAKTVRPGLVVLSAGAVQSAVLLLKSATNQYEAGLANASGQVGRNFMNHNATAVIAVDPRFTNNSMYQKTFGFNDFYLTDGKGGYPLGNVQLLGRVSAPVLKGSMPRVPEPLLQLMTRHSIDFYAMSEDLPSPESRVRVEGERIILDWRRSNTKAHEMLVKKLKQTLRGAGFPLVLSKPFDRRTPSHQCGTVRIGSDPAEAPLDPFCRSFDHRNLFVVDASFLPSSAAINPSLTIAAQALRVADHILHADLGAERASGSVGMRI